jgi:hypothetical protein
MSRHSDRYWRERASLRYLDALDAGDLDAVAAIWDEAAGDPALEALLRELDDGLYAEEGPGADFRADAARVFELARRHLPSAFPPEEPAGPLTAAEVARRLEAEPEFRRLGPGDRLAHARMLAEAAPLPDYLGQPQLERWVRDLSVAASPHYWRAFQKVAVLLTMARCQREGRLAAARPASNSNTQGGPS